ncbi:MAG: MBL fold metallo-hydrolase [Armatimonadota bacterium]|nr:MBL fold metallo-hydrolase [Armatimonadota bacterium]MDR7452136.1 MBL fold metallo-hydrolase [Armatimonadota bacterium]MDR7467860.1 MBL fold metallo-hydrolase [Armatimonadota bacterium]MDR7494748.1 MBL fold metallo-hydrolase [Armatimonadota bacterium]MDR7499573.1 MBL fold metallo-hydrolase [Armatimonadota bacterium]
MIRLRRFGEVTQLAMARTVLGRPLYTACAYFLDGLLVDDGPPATAGELTRVLADLEVRQVVLTHAHEDHAGANPVLQARGLTPLAHPRALDLLARPPDQRPYQRLVWGRQPPSTAAPLGEEVRTKHHYFRVVHTPGHSADHISLFDERTGWLFAGDLFLSPYVKVMRLDENPHQTIASLRRVLALPVTTLFCAGGKVVEDGRAALQRKLDFMERLRDEARARAARGMKPTRIRQELLGEETWWPLATSGHFSKQNLIDALLRDEPPAS